ncbi:MAG: hypothetical protein PUE73_03425 [Eubacteriales bacterium]|nr:hypothetical protein [Eubacteriales bacterium]
MYFEFDNCVFNLAEKEEQLTARLAGDDKELFQNYVSDYIEYSTTSNADSFISDKITEQGTTTGYNKAIKKKTGGLNYVCYQC